MTDALSDKMKNLVGFIAKSLVEKPEEVVVESHESEKTVLVEIKVASEDLGRVIGKDGSTINAIRVILQTAAASHDKKARLDLLS
ncbi:MAG: KH domain-containing protein [Syntrophobacterales bacterium]|nr:KH domain-containing protein [Syntrophobacterales bacterium]